ncbi:MAG: DUF1667 domain-containing protein [Synergistaceae bacterium]|jgi:CxxC motif-containing protein|nr:DUF1667 domain-containing protein [Synergistaceae bacterium]
MEASRAPSKGEFICVTCPNGCPIEAEYIREPGKPGTLLSFTGNKCPKGEAWVRQEIENPMRTIATSIPVTGGSFLNTSVRTKSAVPLGEVFEVMKAVRATPPLQAPVKIGQVVLRAAGVDVIATRNVAKI